MNSNAVVPAAVALSVPTQASMTALAAAAYENGSITNAQYQNLSNQLSTLGNSLSESANGVFVNYLNRLSTINHNLNFCFESLRDTLQAPLKKENISNGYITNFDQLYKKSQCSNGPFSDCCRSLKDKMLKESNGSAYETSFEENARNKHLDPKTRNVRSWNVIDKFGKFLCCINYDLQNHGFEIFDSLGRHQGERRCSDLTNSELCKPTNAEEASRNLGVHPSTIHSSPDHENHNPRGGCANYPE